MISCVLIGWELWSIQVQTMKIMWWWYKFSFCMHDFPIGVKENGHKKMSTAMLLKKQITSHFPWYILLKRPLKWHQNVKNFAVKPFTCSSIVDKSTVWPWKTVDGLLNHVEMYSTSQREANLLCYPLKRNVSIGYWYPAFKHLALVVQMLDSMNAIHWIKKYLSNR